MRTTRQKHKSTDRENKKRAARRADRPVGKSLPKVEITFSNEEAARHFAGWLCGSGEQHYWMWMECRETEDDGPITAVNFDYHGPNGGAFGTKIATKCARLDDPDPVAVPTGSAPEDR